MKYASGQKYMSSPVKPFYGSTYGFTLPELMITLAVVAILIAISAPSMQSMIVNQRVASTTRDVYGSLLLARSEAVKRHQSISVCSSVNGASCDEDNTGWHHGWLIFSDKNQDGIFDGDDQLLRAVPEQAALITITWNRGYSVTFNSRGQTTTAGSFEICLDNIIRAIVMTVTGRARVEERQVCS